MLLAAMAAAISNPVDLAMSTSIVVPPSTHRLPTISASDILQDLQSDGLSTLSSGLHSLDTLLSGGTDKIPGGFERGKVTEIWGPSGAGKTALTLQTAAKSLLAGNHVVWLDASETLNGSRLQSAVDTMDTKEDDDNDDALQRFHHTSVPTLAHLLAMVIHPRTDFFPEKTALLVLTGVNTLVDLDYPRSHQYGLSSRTEQQKWQANRRFTVLGSLARGLSKLAALRNLAVIVTTGCSTRGRNSTGLRLALVPGIGGSEWDAAIHGRMVVFRDFNSHFIGLQKIQGRSLISREEVGEPGRIISVNITDRGLLEEASKNDTDLETIIEPPIANKTMSSPQKARKRVFEEIADSEGEDVDEYGWAETDEDVLATRTSGGEDPAAVEADSSPPRDWKTYDHR